MTARHNLPIRSAPGPVAGEDLPRMPEFMQHPGATCKRKDVDAELFFPSKGQSTQHAKALCRQCPVLEECREWALAQPAGLHGVWGATDEMDRKALRRSRHCRECEGDLPLARRNGGYRYCSDACRDIAVQRQEAVAAEKRKLAS